MEHNSLLNFRLSAHRQPAAGDLIITVAWSNGLRDEPRPIPQKKLAKLVN